jgi:hypothetical protein
MMPTEDESARRFVSLFGGARENSDLVGIAKAACKEGYAVIAVKPRSKEPMCTLTDRARKAADKMAAHAARESGSKHWERVTHPCGRNHAITDPAEAERVFKRLVAADPDLNIGLEVGASRLLLVDADTTDEMTSFTKLWAQREGLQDLTNAAPTVRTPGVLRAVGENGEEAWVHKDGGHFWFLLPEGVDFRQAKAPSMKIGIGNTKATLMFRDQLGLVPPSVRDEGPYKMASDIQPAPAWMIEDLHSHIAGEALKREKGRQKALDDNDPIQVWAAGVPWDEILGRYGWTTQGRLDSCGCEVWTRPGDWSSPKSATAHEVGCATIPITGGVLRLWTTNPPPELTGRENWSKLQVIAAYEYGGDITDAMRGLGLLPDPSNAEPTIIRSHDLARLAKIEQENQRRHESPRNDEEDDQESEEDPEDQDPVDKLISELIPASGLDAIPRPAPLIDGILDRNSLVRVIGTSGHGKTFVMIDLAAHVALGKPWLGRECAQGRVVYLVAEGVSGMRARVRAWETHHGVELGDRVLFLPRAVQIMSRTDWDIWVVALKKLKPSLVVLDTQARITVGANENDFKDMSVVVDRAELLREQTAACVALVHHKGRQGDHGRGSTVVPAALDTEISVTRQGKDRITILSEKQKDREDFSPISLNLVPFEESAVLVQPGTERPFEDSNEISEKSPTRDRIAALMYRTFHLGNGATKAEVWMVVKERDRGPRGKPMSRSSFATAWSQLEGDGVLIVNETEAGKRWELSEAEASRLGLRRLRLVSTEDEL